MRSECLDIKFLNNAHYYSKYLRKMYCKKENNRETNKKYI